MEKNNFELTHDRKIDMRNCIEVINNVKKMVEDIKIDLLNVNDNDIECFILVDSIAKAMTQAAYHAEQLDWALLRRKQ